MQSQLSQKERMFLEDLKSEEELCVTKYKAYAQQTQDSELSQLFNKLSSEEHKHYDTVNQMLQGNMQSGGQGKSGQQGQNAGKTNMQGLQSVQLGGQMAQNAGQSKSQVSSGNSSDKTLLHDMLSTEKYVSSSYDKSIFESAQPTVRQALQQIQKDEQGHGEQLFQYMNSHGMYQVQ
jgi:Coat F domain.